jgi:hypothetical protein
MRLGIIFFGAPHRGTDKAVYGKVLANVAQTMIHRPPARLVSALQTNSDVLMRLTSHFRFQLPQYQVVRVQPEPVGTHPGGFNPRGLGSRRFWDPQNQTLSQLSCQTAMEG